jgi:hypothetical protein
MTYVTHPDFLRDPKVRERQRLGTAFLVINLAAVATVMLPVREREGITAAHAPFRIGPLGCGRSIDHGGGGRCEVFGREGEAWEKCKFDTVNKMNESESSVVPSDWSSL